MPRKIAMIGTAESGRSAPYNDPSWEIWGVSGRHPYVTRANRWFEIHRLAGEPKDWADLWRERMKEFLADTELLMFYPEPGLGKKVIQYPVEKITARFGTFFMTSSFAWMIALAIDEMCPIVDGRPTIAEKGSMIGLWGVDMEYGTEYQEQRAGLRHFMQAADLLGITVSRLADSGIAYDPIPYPLWQDDPLLSKLTLRNNKAVDQLTKFEESIRATREMIAHTNGAISEIENMTRVMPEGESAPAYDPAKRIAALEMQRTQLLETSSTISKDIVHWTAVAEEQRWLKDYLMP